MVHSYLQRHDFKIILNSEVLIGHQKINEIEIQHKSECGSKNFEIWYHTRLNSQTIDMFDEIGPPASNTLKFLTYNRFMTIMRLVFKKIFLEFGFPTGELGRTFYQIKIPRKLNPCPIINVLRTAE